MTSSPYSWLMLGGIVVSICFWARLARKDDRLLVIYLAALLGAFLGARVVYVLAEGWMHLGAPDMWRQLATGKSILGALLGGYAGVEIAKRAVKYSGVTGYWFALIAPVGIVLGRIGCLFQGCCLGRICAPAWFTINDTAGTPRWPAVPVEILFNLAAIAVFFCLRKVSRLKGQHFPIYLMAYGGFRFSHEFLRDTPRVAGSITGYQFAALAVLALGVTGFLRRRKQRLKQCSTGHPL
jgi:phosphatidylglycerol:prolipoprotein diacylglycerol transferase